MDGVTQPGKGTGGGSHLCTDRDVGRTQEDRKKAPVSGVFTALRTMGELGLGVCLATRESIFYPET